MVDTIWVWLKIKQEGQTAGFGPCFHLPGQPILEFRFFEFATAISLVGFRGFLRSGETWTSHRRTPQESLAPSGRKMARLAGAYDLFPESGELCGIGGFCIVSLATGLDWFHCICQGQIFFLHRSPALGVLTSDEKGEYCYLVQFCLGGGARSWGLLQTYVFIYTIDQVWTI